MATLKESVYTLLNDDATLRILLGYNATTKPRCVFWQMPPKTPAIPLVTYFIGSQLMYKPRQVVFNITAWGSNYEAVQDRIFDMLHKQLAITASDYSFKGMLFDGAGPELYDEDLRVPYCQHRYRAYAWKT